VIRSTLSLLFALTSVIPGIVHAEGSPESMIAELRGLQLGAGGYLLGETLSLDEIAEARNNPARTYPGTVQLPRESFHVVADAESGLILAIFERKEDASADDVTSMISRLMLQFGEPTTSAHDQLVYWAWSRSGRIHDDSFQEAKQTGELAVLATVKFSSSMVLTQDMSNENTRDSGTIYYIITSNPLLEAYAGEW
jgi:hypothetical protein